MREETCHRHYMGYSFQLGQVRSESLTCTFRASCCSARLSRAQVSGKKRRRGRRESVSGYFCLSVFVQYTIMMDPNKKKTQQRYFICLMKCFYLTTHSTHFLLRLYGVRHMIKDHSDRERGNPLPPHGLLFPISSKVFLYASSHIPRTFITPVVEHWLEREIAQWVHHEGSIRRTIVYV